VSAIAIGGIVFVCVFGGALLGVLLQSALPEHHLSTDTKDVVKLTIALVATMSALLLSLLVATAKSAYDTRSNELTQMSADIVVLDRLLAHYGPETKEARALLRSSVAAALERFRRADHGGPASLEPTGSFEIIYDKIEELSPQSEALRLLQGQALNTAISLGRTRLLLFENVGSSIPFPFLLVLVFWLAVIFVSFGLFAPRNGTVVAAFLVTALSVSAAISLILELDRSFEGILQLSSAPLHAALARLGGL
jgi:hypothetical protein